jgi:ATP-dependent protease ClpP protease subunit
MSHRLSIMGRIGASLWEDGVTAKAVAEFLQELPKKDGKELRVGPVMTPGGSITEGAAIRQLLEDEVQRRDVIFEIYGEAASIGAHIVIGTHGARVEMARDAVLMLHPPYMSGINVAGIKEMEMYARNLRGSAAAIAAAVEHRAPGIDAEELCRQFAERSPLAYYEIRATDAVELGLADGILESPDPEFAAMAAEETDAQASQHEEDA